MSKRRLGLVAAGLLAAFALPSSGWTQAAYPDKPIRFIVPYGPGGTVDPTARITAAAIGPILGQQVIVENKPGAAGQIGTEFAVRQPADGYTVLIHTNIVASEPCLKSDLPYNFLQEMTPVMALVETPFVVLVHPSVPANNMKELVAYMKANPNELRYGASGIASSGHLRGEQFKLETGTEMRFIPFKDGGSTLTGLLRNDINVAVDTLPGSLAMVQDGRMKLLAVGSQRLSQVPNTPTMEESGFKPLASQWIGAYVNSKTPPEIVKKLADAFKKALAEPAVKEQFSKIVFSIVGTDQATTAKNVKDETEMWCRTVKAAGIKLQ